MDWHYLPAPALLCICQHLADFVDYYAFAGTCKAWRDVASFGKRAFMASQPPLLCDTKGERFYSPLNGKCYKKRRISAIIRRLRGTVADVSHGYLVVEAGCAPREKRILLLNPFTNHEVGNLPRLHVDFVNWVVLTAPPASPDCVVVACTSLHCRPTWTWGGPASMKNSIEYSRPGDSQWALFEWDTNVEDTVKPVVSADGRVYAWAPEGDEVELVIMDFHHRPKRTRLCTVAFPERYPHPVCLTDPRGELLVVRAAFASNPDGSADVKHGTFEIYRLDPSEQQWVQKNDSIGNRALVMDCFRCIVASNPGRWGGRGDDLYLFGYDSEAWRFRLKDAGVASHLAPPFPGKKRHNRGLWLPPADAC